jgi:AcrR family transcriptional regulator
VYSNFANKEELFLALFQAGFERELEALHATLAMSAAPPESRISDFVKLIEDEWQSEPRDLGVLFQEFWLYALRNPAARERLVDLEEQQVRSISHILQEERQRLGWEPLESPERTARLVVMLFRGISSLRILQPEAVDRDLVEAAISFVARALEGA